MKTTYVPLAFALLATALLPVAARAQWPEPQLLQREAAKGRPATGPWKQVAAIESCERPSFGGSGLGPGGPPARSGNHAVIAFLDNERFAIADGEHPIRVFDADSGALLRTFGEPEADNWQRREMVVSADGRLLVLLPDPEPVIWDTRTGQRVARLPRYEDKYTAGSFLPDDRALATYRSERSRGDVPGNLQVWDIVEEQGKVTLRQSLDADKDARGMSTVGPYLLLRNYRRSQVFDAASLKVLLQQPHQTDEEFLFLTPPRDKEPGWLGVLVYSSRTAGSWMDQRPQFRLLSLPDGQEVRRWDCPLEEDKQNDHRYQAGYAVSPQRTVIAISQEGRVNFFNFQTGVKLSTVAANNKYDHPAVIFADENHAFLGQQRWGEKLSVVEVSSGREVAAIPESDYVPIVSPDGRHLLARREMMPSDIMPGQPPRKVYSYLLHPLVVLWRQTGDYPVER